MSRLTAKVGPLLLVLCASALVLAQDLGDLTRRINSGCDLLKKGDLDQAQRIYEDLLRQYPENPLALNNLATVMAQRGKYEQALTYLNQAKARAQGYRVSLERVCDLDSVCAAFRMSEDPARGEELERVVKENILMVEMARASRPSGGRR